MKLTIAAIVVLSVIQISCAQHTIPSPEAIGHLFQGEVIGDDLILQTEDTVYLVKGTDFTETPQVLLEESVEDYPVFNGLMIFEGNILVSLVNGYGYENPEDPPTLLWSINPETGIATASGREFLIESDQSDKVTYYVARVNWMDRDPASGALVTNPGLTGFYYSYNDGETWNPFPGERMTGGAAWARAAMSGNQLFFAHNGWVELMIFRRTFDLTSTIPTISEAEQVYNSNIVGELGIGFIQGQNVNLFLSNYGVYEMGDENFSELINAVELTTLDRSSLVDMEISDNGSDLLLLFQEQNYDKSVQHGKIFLSKDGGETWNFQPPIIDLQSRKARWMELGKGGNLILGFSSNEDGEHSVEIFPTADGIVQFLNETAWISGSSWSHPELGRIIESSNGWYYSEEIGGWFYIDSSNPNWGWSSSLGWFFPIQNEFKYIYVLKTSSYIYHQVLGQGIHWQYNYLTTGWEIFDF